MRIIIGSDHAGYELKEQLKEYLNNNGNECIDNGNKYDSQDDYPDIAKQVANKVASKEYDRGIIICGSGIGIGIAANKVRGIRCGTCNDIYLAKMARQDNDINVLALGARIIDFEKAKIIIDIFVNTEFLGERHLRRVNKIKDIEDSQKG